MKAVRALILSTHTGGGHDSAAHAVAEALEERGVEARVMDCVAFGGEWLSKCVSKAYVKWVQISPSSFGKAYKGCKFISTTRVKSPVYAFNAAYAFRMKKFLAEYDPDMIVCTHIFGGHSVTHLRRREEYSGLLAMVMTDYTVHPFTEDVECDLLFVPGVAENTAKQMGLPADAVQPTGIPVSLECVPCHDKRAAKEACGLDPDKKHVLLVGGSMGAGNLPQIIGQLLPALGNDGHLTVVCGSNERAKERAKEEYGTDPRVSIRGKVVPLTPLTAAADVLITKSGGLTSTEAMTIGTPIIVTHPIEGCETENVKFMEENGMALWAHTAEQLTAYVERLLRSDAERERMVANQRAHIDPDCARKIADILIKRTAELTCQEVPDARKA